MKIKAYAIRWKGEFKELYGIENSGIVSLHETKPVVTQPKIWEVVEGEFTFNK